MPRGAGGDQLAVWDVPARRLKQQWTISGGIVGLAISPDGQRLALNVTSAKQGVELVHGPSSLMILNVPVCLQLPEAEARQLGQRPPVAPLPERFRKK
jgi:hypothetical protein